MRTGQTSKSQWALCPFLDNYAEGVWICVLSAAACDIPQAQQFSGLRERLKVFHQTLHPERSPAIPMTAQRLRVINKVTNTLTSLSQPNWCMCHSCSPQKKCVLDNETIDTLVQQV